MEELSRQMRLMLIVGGTVFGVLFGVGVGYGYLAFAGRSAPAGAEFSSLDDLRRSMLTRDERDISSDRSVSFRSIIQPHPEDEIIYTLRPNLEVKFQKVPVRTNSFGMRSPERPVEKPANTHRIALLGDSFAFGWGVEQDKVFAQVLEDRLNQFTNGSPKVEVLNFGVPGYSTFQEVAQFLETGAAFQPDSILIYFIENDFGMPFFVRDFTTESESLSPSVGIESMRKKVKAGTDTEAQKRMNTLLRNVNSNYSIIKLLDHYKGKNVPVYLAINPRRNWQFDVGRLWVIKQRPDLIHLPLRDRYMELFEGSGLKIEDIKLKGDPHPNWRGHELLGATLADAFEAEFKKRGIGAYESVVAVPSDSGSQ